jgi:hypothetical protein
VGGLEQALERWMPHTRTVEPVARRILSLGGEEDPVAAAGRWPRALGFYLGKPIWLDAHDIEGEIAEERRHRDHTYEGLEGLAALWRSRPRLWVVLGTENYARAFESVLGARVDRTFAAGRWILARNFGENQDRH